MQHTEGIRQSREDREELERNIKELEKEIEQIEREWHPHLAPETPMKIKEYRRLRRLRDEPKEEEQ